ncbi:MULTISPECIES: hypothetical protein [Catenuloplanes]|uniref:Uncharacterized protein n=1 Tax=Catenuloplanes niger TaxID=587534 RepID=A0AAE3ZX40_9ACTN|nr:hypothetical protein [Catenuloplanes niger]MDR7326450.1 hypothetical protein [Catenuloplanes niger]
MTTETHVPFRTRLWRAIVAAVRGPDPVPEPEPGRITERQESTEPIIVAAHGQVFDFLVRPSYTWTAHGVERPVLRSWLPHLTAIARRELTELAAGLARKHPPHDALPFETALNEALGLRDWRFDRRDAEIRCRPRVRVLLDARVRDQIQPFLERQIEQQYRHDLEVQRAALLKTRVQVWLDVLAGMIDKPLVSGATELTDDQLSTVMARLIADRKAVTDMLNDLMTEPGDIDDFERARFEEMVAQIRREEGLAP